MNIQCSVVQMGSFTGYVIGVLFDPTAPTVPVANQPYLSLPISGTGLLSFTGLNNQNYIFREYLSTDTNYLQGTQIGTDIQIDAGQTSNGVTRNDLWIDSSSITSGNTYNDASLVGWVYWVEERGIGTLRPGIDIQYLSGGGWQFINGYTVQTGEEFVLHFQPQISASGNSTPSSGNPGGQIFLIDSTNNPITATKTLAASDMGKIWNIQSASGGTINITLPDPSTVPDGKITAFISEGGSHIMAALISTTQIKFCGQTISGSGNYKAFYLAQGEMCQLYKIGSTWYILHENTAFKDVGKIQESLFAQELNTLLCDGNRKIRANYPRMWEYITRLANTDVIADSLWKYFDPNNLYYPNIGKFSFGDGTLTTGTTFRMPLIMEAWDSLNNLVSGGFTRGIGNPADFVDTILGSLRTAGQGQKDKVGNFMAQIEGRLIHKSGGSNEIVALGVPPAPVAGMANPDTTDTPTAGNNFTDLRTFLTSQYNTNPSYQTSNKETSPANNAVYKFMKY